MKSLIKGKLRKILNEQFKKREFEKKSTIFNQSHWGDIGNKHAFKVTKVTPYKLDDQLFTHLLVFDIEVVIKNNEVFGDQYYISRFKKFTNLYKRDFYQVYKWFFPPSLSKVSLKFDKIKIIRRQG